MNLSEKQLKRAASVRQILIVVLIISGIMMMLSPMFIMLSNWLKTHPPSSHVVYYFTQPLDLTGWAPMTLATRELIAAGKMGHVEYQELPSLIGVERDPANPRHGEIIDHQTLAWWRFAPSANTD